MTGVATSLGALQEAVQEDPQLEPAEKETLLRFAKDEDVVHVHTDEPALARRFLAHPEAETRRVILLDGDRRPRIPFDDWSGEPIVGASVELPVGALTVKNRSRKSSQHAPIVSERVYENLEEGEP